MDEPEQTPETLLDQLSAPERQLRWKAARRLAHDIDIGRARGVHYRAACVPVLLEILNEHDAHSAFEAEDSARRLVDIGERTIEVRSCMARCLARAQDELIALEAALSPIQNSALPERDALRSRIEASRSLIECLRSYLEDFRASPVASFAPPAAATVTAAAESRRPGKGGSVSLLLPALALLLVIGGVAALLLSHRRRSEANLNSALTAPERLPAAPSASAGTAQDH
jgi:hypothetical protein